MWICFASIITLPDRIKAEFYTKKILSPPGVFCKEIKNHLSLGSQCLPDHKPAKSGG